MTAILNFWWMSTSHDNGSDTIEKLDPENMGIAVEILLLCALDLEICLGGQMTPTNVAKKPLPGQWLNNSSIVAILIQQSDSVLALFEFSLHRKK